MPQSDFSDSKSFYAEAHNTQLLMQDISTQVRSLYRYIYWSDCQLYRAILNRFPDSDDILLCICCGVARVKCLLWFRLTWSRQIVTRDTAWPRDTSSPLHRTSGGLSSSSANNRDPDPDTHLAHTFYRRDLYIALYNLHYLRNVKILKIDFYEIRCILLSWTHKRCW